MGVHYLQTDRLVLRQFTEADVDNLVELDADPDVMFFVNGGRRTPREYIEQVLLPAWLSYYAESPGLGFWAAEEKATGPASEPRQGRPGASACVVSPRIRKPHPS